MRKSSKKEEHEYASADVCSELEYITKIPVTKAWRGKKVVSRAIKATEKPAYTREQLQKFLNDVVSNEAQEIGDASLNYWVKNNAMTASRNLYKVAMFIGKEKFYQEDESLADAYGKIILNYYKYKHDIRRSDSKTQKD